MKLLADENLDAPIVAWLRKLGHDVLFMVEHGPGTSDEEFLRWQSETVASLSRRTATSAS